MTRKRAKHKLLCIYTNDCSEIWCRRHNTWFSHCDCRLSLFRDLSQADMQRIYPHMLRVYLELGVAYGFFYDLP